MSQPSQPLEPSTPRVGVVTVTFNSATVIEPFLDSVLAQRYRNFVVYVVDSGSSDDTLARIERRAGDRIVVIPNAGNIGIAAGNNLGIAAAREAGCSHVLLVNNDTEFSPDLLTGLLDALRVHKAEMAAPKILVYGTNTIWYAGGAFVAARGFASAHFGDGQIDRGRYDRARAVDFAPACCLLVAMRVFDVVGEMDERYFCYWEDADFCYRAKQAGIRLVYDPAVVLQHKVSTLTQGKDSPFSVRFGARNRAYFIRKNVPRHLQAPSLLFCRARYLMRAIVGEDDWSTYRLRRRSFDEGLALWKSGLAKPLG